MELLQVHLKNLFNFNFKSPIIVAAVLGALALAVMTQKLKLQSQDLIENVSDNPPEPMPTPVEKTTTATQPTQPFLPEKMPPTPPPNPARVANEIFATKFGLSFEIPKGAHVDLETDLNGQMQIASMYFDQSTKLALHIYAYSGEVNRTQLLTYLNEETNISPADWNETTASLGLEKRGFKKETILVARDLKYYIQYEVIYATSGNGKTHYMLLWESTDVKFTRGRELMDAFHASLKVKQ